MDYGKRLNLLQKKIKKEEAWLFEEPTTLYYLTGLKLSLGIVIVTQKNACLLVDARYIEHARKESPIPVQKLEEGALTNCLKNVPFDKVHKLSVSSSETTCHRLSVLRKQLCRTDEALKKRGMKIVLKKSPVPDLRMVKNAQELTLLSNAAELGSQGFDYLLKILKEGMTELEAVLELEIFWRRSGGDKLAFDPIIAFGKGSSIPHYHPENIPLKAGDTVLIDIGVTKAGYHSDMTRTIFFRSASKKMREIYDLVLEAQQAALSLCKPGVTVGELDRAARKVIDKSGYGDAFSHSLGHGIGLEVHELPHLTGRKPYDRVKLKEGMVVTIEPGIYLGDVGGVRIEDTIAITKNGFQNLTQRPKDLLIL